MRNTEKKHPFTIICNKCGSNDVNITNAMCFGECEGYLIKCNNCGLSSRDNENNKI